LGKTVKPASSPAHAGTSTPRDYSLRCLEILVFAFVSGRRYECTVGILLAQHFAHVLDIVLLRERAKVVIAEHAQ
jgi:hypothetical protein